ncbi:MAG: VOC family protein [Gammaproteobacteria bacterium]|nr:VOC family protein [Gammaproteobacteria bacterium]
MRLQLALNVDNLGEAIDFYSKLFDTRPHKIRTGYANFSINKPPLKLVLFENPEAKDRINHLGVEVFNPREITELSQRLQESGILAEIRTNETCCHATQDKLWLHEPQGLHWEWYHITDDNPDNMKTSQSSACCDGTNCA